MDPHSIINLTKPAFEQAISEGTWLVDFWAPWCAPCRKQGKLIDDNLADLTATGAMVGKVNVDDEPELAARFGIQSIPTLLVFKGGELIKSFVGVQTVEILKDALA